MRRLKLFRNVLTYILFIFILVPEVMVAQMENDIAGEYKQDSIDRPVFPLNSWTNDSVSGNDSSKWAAAMYSGPPYEEWGSKIYLGKDHQAGHSLGAGNDCKTGGGTWKMKADTITVSLTYTMCERYYNSNNNMTFFTKEVIEKYVLKDHCLVRIDEPYDRRYCKWGQ